MYALSSALNRTTMTCIRIKGIIHTIWSRQVTINKPSRTESNLGTQYCDPRRGNTCPIQQGKLQYYSSLKPRKPRTSLAQRRNQTVVYSVIQFNREFMDSKHIMDQTNNTFCISGMGRSGTKLLAQTFNLSPTWKVAHEPGEAGGIRKARDCRYQVTRWHDKHMYGEVNSYMRWAFLDLPVSARACLMRHPFDLARTIYNRKNGLSADLRFQLVEVFGFLDDWIDNHGVRHFFFEHFTRDLDRLLEIAHYVGIDDLSLPAGHLDRPTNATPDRKVKAKTFEDLPEEVRSWAVENLSCYREKYYHEDGTPRE